MGLLASLLPGVRELRAPFAAGALWLIALYFAAPDIVAGFAETPSVSVAVDALGGSPAVLAVGSAGLAYLLGVAIGGVITPLTDLAGECLLRFGKWVEGKRAYSVLDGRRTPLRRPLWLFEVVKRMELNVWPLTIAGRSLLIDALQARLSRAGVPGSASMMFPLKNVLANLRFSAAQLANTVPSQYQEYDRLRGEVDLRVAIAPALIVSAVVVPVGPKWAVIGGFSFIAVMLWIQAGRTTRAASDLLANAAYLDHLKVPAIESFAAELEKLNPKPTTSGAWIAGMIMTLERLGMYEDSQAMLEEAGYLEDEVDQGDVLEALPQNSFQRAHLDAVAERTRLRGSPLRDS